MTKNDIFIFTWLEDLRGLEQMSDSACLLERNSDWKLVRQEDLSCAQIIQRGQFLLDTKAYSDINIQDKHGNTFLHYASQYHSKKLMMSILNLGANPYIENNQGRNAFQVSREYGFMYRFWQDIEQSELMRFEAFRQRSLSFHPDFRDTLFDLLMDKNFTFSSSLTAQIDYVHQTGLMSNKNLISMIFLSHNPVSKEHFNYLLNMERTPDDNAQIIYRYAKHIMADVLGREFENELHTLIEPMNLTFSTQASYERLTEVFRENYFIRRFETNPIAALFVNKIFQTIIEEELLEKDSKFRSLADFVFGEHPALHAAYLQNKLHANPFKSKTIKI